jgi:hypothetical protein
LDNYWPNWSISSFANYKIELATRNFARSGLASFVTIVHADAGRVLERAADSAFDFIFLDSERTEYPGWWPNIDECLGLAVPWWSITPLLILWRWRRLLLSSKATTASQQVLCLWAMAS